MSKLKNKVAEVTGASKRIGASIAKHFAAAWITGEQISVSGDVWFLNIKNKKGRQLNGIIG